MIDDEIIMQNLIHILVIGFSNKYPALNVRKDPFILELIMRNKKQTKDILASSKICCVCEKTRVSSPILTSIKQLPAPVCSIECLTKIKNV